MQRESKDGDSTGAKTSTSKKEKKWGFIKKVGGQYKQFSGGRGSPEGQKLLTQFEGEGQRGHHTKAEGNTPLIGTSLIVTTNCLFLSTGKVLRGSRGPRKCKKLEWVLGCGEEGLKKKAKISHVIPG